MRYFTDEKIQEMKESIKASYDPKDSAIYLAYVTKIEMLDKRNDQLGDCKDELMQAILELEKVSKRYIHRGRADPNDEDADAFEYENYDFQ